MIEHKKQKFWNTCSYATLGMILNKPESHFYQYNYLLDNRRRKITGLYNWQVGEILNQEKVESITVGHFHQIFDQNSFLINLSFRFPIYCSGHFKEKVCQRGRPRERHHAFALFEGKIFDPSEKFSIDIGRDFYNYDCTIKSYIIVLIENQNYGKGKRND